MEERISLLNLLPRMMVAGQAPLCEDVYRVIQHSGIGRAWMSRYFYQRHRQAVRDILLNQDETILLQHLIETQQKTDIFLAIGAFRYQSAIVRAVSREQFLFWRHCLGDRIHSLLLASELKITAEAEIVEQPDAVAIRCEGFMELQHWWRTKEIAGFELLQLMQPVSTGIELSPSMLLTEQMIQILKILFEQEGI